MNDFSRHSCGVASMSEQVMPPRVAGPGVTGVLPEYRTIAANLATAPTVSVVIPAKNEASNLGHFFASIPSWVDEIVLVDGHSADDTVGVARWQCPDVEIVAQQRCSVGAAREMPCWPDSKRAKARSS
jgi:hypothetical protein